MREQPKRMHVRIPKLMRYELTANVYQGMDMQPADENGLADPYIKVSRPLLAPPAYPSPTHTSRSLALCSPPLRIPRRPVHQGISRGS